MTTNFMRTPPTFRGGTLGELSYSSDSDIDNTVHQILAFCVVTYGLVGLMWLAYWRYGCNFRVGSEMKMVLLCVTWASTSVGMHVLNKALVTSLSTPSLVAAAQMAITVLASVVMSAREILSADKTQVLYWLIVPLFFSGMLCSSAYTYMYISLSMLTIIRNLSPVISLPIERLVMPDHQQPRVGTLSVVAIVIMLLGAVIYGGGVQDIRMIGVMLAFLNMAIAVSDRVIQRRLLTNECKDLSSGLCTLMTNFFALLPTMAFAARSGEFGVAQSVDGVSNWGRAEVRALIVVSGFVGLGIGYLGFECQRMISATSFFVLQNSSKVVVVAAGVVFFDDPLMPSTVLGVALSLLGSFMYSQAQRTLPKEEKAETEPLIEPPKAKV